MSTDRHRPQADGPTVPLPRSFFARDSVELAPLLIGKLLRSEGVTLRITEVEAYREDDSACHARSGITPRNAPIWGPPGHAYVYLCYGIHNMLNVVSDREGRASAVLIRACEPVSGLEIIRERRGRRDGPELLDGPGKVGAALALDVSWSGHPLFLRGGLELLDGAPPESLLVGARIGIDHASPVDVARPWRFAAGDSRFVSRPKELRRYRSSTREE